MENKFNFTKKDIEKLPLPVAGKRAYYFDTQTRGLTLDVTSFGSKTFYYKRTVNYKRKQYLIGRFPETTVEVARKKSIEIGGQINAGNEPDTARRLSNEPSLGDLLEAYLEGHARQHCAAAKEMEAVFRRYLTDLKPKPISEITKMDAQTKLNEIGANHGHVAANHTLTYTRAALNWCIRTELLKTENPWNNARKFKTMSRERFLRPEEMQRFFEALEKTDADFRDYVCISLYTGARRTNVMSMKWDQVDFTLGTWTIPRTKNDDYHVIPLTSSAAKILKRRSQNPNSRFEKELTDVWVFPGTGKTGHLVETKRAWSSLMSAAGISDLRLHDLRRTLGSYMAMGNQSLHIIGKALGHRSPTATQVYSRMTFDPIRDAMEKAQLDMLDAAASERSRSGNEVQLPSES